MKPALALESNVPTTSPNTDIRGTSGRPVSAPLGLRVALREHWPEYVMEAAELGLFMISACLVVALLEHPASPLNHAIPHPVVRRVLTGLAMGLTAIGIIYSPWGKQSG